MAPQVFFDRFRSLEMNSIASDIETITSPLNGIEVVPNSGFLATFNLAEPLDIQQILTSVELNQEILQLANEFLYLKGSLLEALQDHAPDEAATFDSNFEPLFASWREDLVEAQGFNASAEAWRIATNGLGFVENAGSSIVETFSAPIKSALNLGSNTVGAVLDRLFDPEAVSDEVADQASALQSLIGTAEDVAVSFLQSPSSTNAGELFRNALADSYTAFDVLNLTQLKFEIAQIVESESPAWAPIQGLVGAALDTISIAEKIFELETISEFRGANELSEKAETVFNHTYHVRASEIAEDLASISRSIGDLVGVNMAQTASAYVAAGTAFVDNLAKNMSVQPTLELDRIEASSTAAREVHERYFDQLVDTFNGVYGALPSNWGLDFADVTPFSDSNFGQSAYFTDPLQRITPGRIGEDTIFAARPGSNVIIGQGDRDTVFFKGSVDEYAIRQGSFDGLEHFTLSSSLVSLPVGLAIEIDGSARGEGIKQLMGIEQLVFSEGEIIALSDLAIFGGDVTGARPDTPGEEIALATPFREDLPLTISQGPGGAVSHGGDLHLSWDFVRSDGISILGEEVLAVADGTVAFVLDTVPDGDDPWASVFPPAEGEARDPSLGPAGALGNVVTLHHEIRGETFYSSYMHLAQGSVPVAVGDAVTAGEAMGTVGLTGSRTGPHAHLTLGPDIGPYTHPTLGDFPDYQIAEGQPGSDLAGRLSFADFGRGDAGTSFASTTPFEGGGWSADPVPDTEPSELNGLKGPGDGSVWSTGTGGQFLNERAFAALKEDGAVVTWGQDSWGGDSSSVVSDLSGGVTEVFATAAAFAALKVDGSVVTWGSEVAGGDSNALADELSGGVAQIFSNRQAFAALKDDGSLVTWGSTQSGGTNWAEGSGAWPIDLSGGVTAVFSTSRAFAALKEDGSVITWGHGLAGGNSSAVAADLSGGVLEVFSTSYAFAALKADGSIVTWGDSDWGGDSSVVSGNLSGEVTHLYSTRAAFAALKADGSVVTWGAQWGGGDSSAVASELSSDVTEIFSTSEAFAVLKADGSVVTWGSEFRGGDSSAIADDLADGVTKITSTGTAFAALKADGSVVTWGWDDFGGNSGTVSDDLAGGVIEIFSTNTAFSALKNDGSVVTWGDNNPYDSSETNYGAVADELSSGVVGLASPFPEQQHPLVGHDDQPWSVSRSEGADTVTFTITRDDAAAEDIVFVSSVQDQGFRNDTDYVGLLNVPLTFAAGEAAQSVTVETLPGAAGRPDKSFGLIVQDSPGDPISQTLAGTRFTIAGDDISLDDLSVDVQDGHAVRALPWLRELLGDLRGQYDSVEISAAGAAEGAFQIGSATQGNSFTLPASQLGDLWFRAGDAGSADSFAVTPLRGDAALAAPGRLTIASADTRPDPSPDAPVNALIPQGSAHVTAEDVVAAARGYVGEDWGTTNCTGLVWAISWTAGTHYHDDRFDTILTEAGEVHDGGYIVPHAWAPNQPEDGWQPVATGSGGGWATAVEAGDAVRLYGVARDTTGDGQIDYEPSFHDGAVNAHSFIVTDVQIDDDGNGYVAIVDNGGDRSDAGIRQVAERRLDVENGEALSGSHLSFMGNPATYYIDRIDQDWFDGNFAQDRNTSVVGPGYGDNVLFRSAEEDNTLTIISNQHTDSIHRITSRDGLGFVEQGGGTTLFTGHEAVTFIGGWGDNTINIGPLAGAGVSDETVHIDLVGGENRLDARALDVRLVVYGGAGADVIRGGEGDDLFHVGPGEDVINGGSGEDTVRFTGARADYEFVSAGGDMHVNDTRGDDERDGDTILSNIERVQFSDGLYSPEGVPLAGSTSILSGVVQTRNGTPMEAAEVMFIPSGGDDSATTLTSAAGAFAFEVVSGMSGRVDAVREYVAGDPAITASDALDVLRLAVGLDPGWGSASAIDFVAADVDRSGSVTSTDALEVLRHVVGLETEHAPQWVFIDADDTGQLETITRDSVHYETGIDLGRLDPEFPDVSFFGILRGNMEEYPV